MSDDNGVGARPFTGGPICASLAGMPTPQSTEAHAPMSVTICGPNLRDQSKGTFHVHATGCADLKRHAAQEPEYRHGWTMDATSRVHVGDEIYADMIDEGSMTTGQGADDCHFFPCCGALPYADAN